MRDIERQFEKQVKEHELLLLKVCRIYARTDADRQDLFQEIVIQLWRSYASFKEQAKFSTYLYRIAINTAITGLRKKRSVVDTYEPANLPHRADTDTNAAAEEQLAQLYKAIEQLNDIEKAIVMLYMEDRSYAEMEEILGTSEGALRVRMNRIKEKLRSLTKTN